MTEESQLQKSISKRFSIAYDKLKEENKFEKQGDFCQAIGMNEGNFQKYYKGERKINNVLLVNMNKKYDVSLDWLLTEKGDIFTQELKPEGVKESGHVYAKHPEMIIATRNLDNKDIIPPNSIPLYDIDINAGNVERLIDDNNSVLIVGWIHLESVSESAGLIGVRAKGNSMATYINGGDIMLIRKIEDWNFINFGFPYVVIGSETSAVKYLRKGEDEKLWRLRSHNETYEEFDIPISSVKHLFAVVRVLKEVTY